MDEVTLNDLLECSVCLERLDTLSKVLPCQHTFCRKCLEEIVKKHKELRCPECRILVNARIEELPPNVLLMRILEGMRNAVPKKQQKNVKPVSNQTVVAVSNVTHIQQLGASEQRNTTNKPTPTHVPHQPYAKALYDFVSKEEGDLSFKRGDIITLKKRIDNHWCQGECGAKQGFFPISYVQIVTPVPSHLPQCKALYDFRMTNDEDEGCLAFAKGDIINVIRRVDENWAEGKLHGKIGIFPLAFVELNNLARSLMKLSTNCQPGPSRVAPPTPTSEDSTPLIPTDHSKSVVTSQQRSQVQTQQQHPTLPTSDSSSTISSGTSATTTPNVSSGNTSSSSSTGPSSPASPPAPKGHQQGSVISSARSTQIVPNSHSCSTPQRSAHSSNNSPTTSEGNPQPNREKRHSFTSLTPPQNSTTTNRHSAEILSSDISQTLLSPHDRSKKSAVTNSSDTPLPVAYIALYPYKPQKPDELELKKGGIYMVSEKCQDGWFKGTSNRTQKCGVFPGNYVQLARGVPSSSTSGSHESGGSPSDNKSAVSYTRSGKSVPSRHASSLKPPELPPRSSSPSVTSATTISSSWHGQQDTASVPSGRSSSAAVVTSPSSHSHLTATPNKSDKLRDKRDKGVSLMRRLASIKRSKSPPPSTYSMDNPVFEDSSAVASSTIHPVHVRSGSCPSQLLQIPPADHHRLFSSSSQRLKHKERPSVLTHNPRNVDHSTNSTNSSPDVHHHRKSNSLDAGSHRPKTGVQTVRERFRCIAPYPPNSDYELELQVYDIIYVHKKRDDGWYKGTQQRTGKTGLFPASFVESF